MIKKREKKGQFYLVATIIIVGLIVGLAVTFNYSSKDNSYEAQDIANELSIESEKVIDYDTLNPATPQLENFANEYSSYIGEDKEIYFIFVEGANKEAYKYSGGEIEYFNNNLIVGSDIQFTLEEEVYNFKLEDGKNFYFVVAHENGGERYVVSG